MTDEKKQKRPGLGSVVKSVLAAGIGVQSDKNRKDDFENGNPLVFIIAGFPHILKQSIIDIPKFGCINLHAGPLPKYRGGSPLNWQIIKNEKKLGISIIKLNVKIDDGKILIKKFFLLKKNENILNAHKKANILFNKYIFESLYKLINKRYLKKIGNNNLKVRTEL